MQHLVQEYKSPNRQDRRRLIDLDSHSAEGGLRDKKYAVCARLGVKGRVIEFLLASGQKSLTRHIKTPFACQVKGRYRVIEP